MSSFLLTPSQALLSMVRISMEILENISLIIIKPRMLHIWYYLNNSYNIELKDIARRISSIIEEKKGI